MLCYREKVVDARDEVYIDIQVSAETAHDMH